LAAQLTFENTITDAFLTDLFKLSTRAHKVSSTRATNAIIELLKYTTHAAKLAARFTEKLLKSSHKTERAAAATALIHLINTQEPSEVSEQLDTIQNALKVGMSDADSVIRDICRSSIPILQSRFPEKYQR